MQPLVEAVWLAHTRDFVEAAMVEGIVETVMSDRLECDSRIKQEALSPDSANAFRQPEHGKNF